MDESTQVPEQRIVYCRELDPDTLLHLSAFGDRYMLRRFDGTDPFEVDGKPDYAEMRRCYRFAVDRPLTPEEAEHPVEDQEYWSERIAELNEDIEEVRAS